MDKEANSWMKMQALVKGIYRIWIGERPGPLAASLAYYALFSIVPITYLGIVIAGIFVDASSLIAQLEERIEELLGEGGGGVAWFAHIGGFLAGLVCIRLMYRKPKGRRRRVFR